MTDAQIAKILKDMVVICDSREQKNQHILDWLKENRIQFKIEKLDSADYSFCLPNYPQLGLDLSVLVERKNSWNEIIGNFTTNRDRFIREFERMRETDIAHIVIENANWSQLFRGTYRSSVPPQSILATLMTWHLRYDCGFWFATTKESPIVIYNLLYYGLRESLKNIQESVDK